MFLDDLPSIAERRRLGIYVSDVENCVAERFGEAVARQLIRACGGQTILLPRQARPKHKVAVAVGLPVLAALIEHYGAPQSIYIPVPSRWRYDVRLRRAIMANPGATNADIGSVAGCSERAVRRCRASMRAAGLNPPAAASCSVAKRNQETTSWPT
ncbi:hypothetical protein [Roseospira navarrensis]|uniref:Mor transcription activator domain-containing protein n=1 Tax=Roseospira navarrensis TaxID=140058 RepID=A0A7X2D557_9PROT|nr:hypothetical protein [Roseospira navarrensis]MQX38541.1 hypothetical protein [Roseospira navarrensis]